MHGYTSPFDYIRDDKFISLYTSLLNTSLHSSSMEYFWTLTPAGTVKVNVDCATPFIPFFNGNPHGLGMIMRNSEGDLLKLSTGIFPAASALENKLNAMLHGLKKSFEGNYKKQITGMHSMSSKIIHTESLRKLQKWRSKHSSA